MCVYCAYLCVCVCILCIPVWVCTCVCVCVCVWCIVHTCVRVTRWFLSLRMAAVCGVVGAVALIKAALVIYAQEDALEGN